MRRGGIIDWSPVAASVRHAVLADALAAALESVVVAHGPVDGARLVRDVVVGHPRVGGPRISAVAAVVLLVAGDEDLRGDVDVRPCSLACDLDSVRQGAGGGVRPARTTEPGSKQPLYDTGGEYELLPKDHHLRNRPAL